MHRYAMLVAGASVMLVGAADAPRDWAATLRADAHAYHDQIAANHPGPVNRLDPEFTERNDAGLRWRCGAPPRRGATLVISGRCAAMSPASTTGMSRST
jgi:hypothetical protein